MHLTIQHTLTNLRQANYLNHRNLTHLRFDLFGSYAPVTMVLATTFSEAQNRNKRGFTDVIKFKYMSTVTKFHSATYVLLLKHNFLLKYLHQ